MSDPIAPSPLEPMALALLVFTLLGGQLLDSEFVIDAMNWIAPIWLMIALSAGALRMVLLNAASIWTSLFWFRLATSVYFGFGSLVPLFVSPMSRSYLDQFYAAQPDEFYRLNLLVASASLCVIGASWAIELIFSWRETHTETSRSEETRIVYALLFCGIGYGVKLLVEVPMMIGGYGEAAIPGAVLQIAELSSVGLYLMSSYAFRANRRWIPTSFALLAADILIGAMQFSKLAMLLPLVMFLLGWISANNSILRALASASLVVVFYAQSQPFIEYGRKSVIDQFHVLGAGSLEDRFQIARDYFTREDANDPRDESQNGLLRLSYVNAGCFAISLFDNGKPGPALDYAFTVLVPRFLWPDKPIITDIGVQFNIMATGNPNSTSEPGYFADVYWAQGWIGDLVWMPILGALLTLYSRFTVRVLSAGRHLYFPLVLLAMKMGLRVDGGFVSDIIGPTAFWFVGLAAVKVAEPWVVMLVDMTAPRHAS